MVIMEEYEVDQEPFHSNDESKIYIYRASRNVDQRPLIVKEKRFNQVQEKETQKRMNLFLNAGLIQGKVQHPNSTDILEFQLKIDEDDNWSLYYILEALDTDLGKDIEARTENPFTEAELLDIALQVADALMYAHNIGIAHRNICPSNIFRKNSTYKISDFYCFFYKWSTPYSSDSMGNTYTMSPQLRLTSAGGDNQYDVFKNDVFALGMTLLQVAGRFEPETMMTAEREKLEAAVSRATEALPVKMQRVVSRMLTYEEERRPTMREVYDELKILSQDVQV